MECKHGWDPNNGVCVLCAIEQQQEQAPDISDIQWVGDCGNCDWKQTPIIKGGETDKPCITCNGTGTITRPATIDEVLEMFPKILRILSGGGTI